MCFMPVYPPTLLTSDRHLMPTFTPTSLASKSS
jgi:hypothetical protein